MFLRSNLSTFKDLLYLNGPVMSIARSPIQHRAFFSTSFWSCYGGTINHFCLVYFQLKTMRQEDYMKTISDLELHYQEFIRNSQGSEMFGDDDKRKMQSQFTDAQKHYQTLVIQLPGHPQHQTGWFGASFSLHQLYVQIL